MRYPATEKLEIIRLVEGSHLPAKRVLDMIGVPRTTFYRWYDRYLSRGASGLEDRPSHPGRVWNRIPDKVRKQVVDLALERPDLDFRVEEARRADDLLRDLLGLLELVLARRRRDVDDLVDARGELLEGQRAVVEGRRQPEAVLDERDLAAAVAGVHRVELRQRHMRLIHDDEEDRKSVV